MVSISKYAWKSELSNSIDKKMYILNYIFNVSDKCTL